MKILIKLFLSILFCSASAVFAQVPQPNKEASETEQIKTGPVSDIMNAGAVRENDTRVQNKGKKEGSVKQVKSARPDMSKSRGARPPDIVRPSGSRIPKGVGRPAGAMRHGRG